MPDKNILSAVESAEKDFREAESKFDKAARALKDKAGRAPVSLALTPGEEMYSMQQQLNYNAKIVKEFASITADYWTACEAIILSLDAICRPLLKENPSATVVGTVSRFISKIIEDVSNLKIDFSVSLNNCDLGDVGSFDPKSSVVVQTVERLWKEAYKGHPDYAKDAKRIKDEEDAKQKKIQDNIKARKEELNKAIAREKELISAAESVNEKREIVVEEGDKRISDFEQKLFTEASNLKTLTVDNERKRLQSELQNATQELKTTSFFDFANKKVLKSKISHFKKQLKNPADSPDIMSQLSNIDNIANSALEQYKDAVNDHVSERFSLVETRRDFSYTPSADSADSYNLMLNILNFLASKNEPQKIDDVFANSGSDSQHKISYLMRQLHTQDFLVRSENHGKAYYAIASDVNVISVEIWEENGKVAKKGIPCPPDNIQELFK